MTIREKGLTNFLAKIEADPSNVMLRERLMLLLSDLPDSTDKVEVVLELARILVPHLPEKAMELAYDAFSYDDSNFEALKIVAACLRQLGRAGKAEVIENEILRFQQSDSSASHPGSSAIASSDGNTSSALSSMFAPTDDTGENSSSEQASVAIELPQFSSSSNSRETPPPLASVDGNAAQTNPADAASSSSLASLQGGTVVQAFQAGDLFNAPPPTPTSESVAPALVDAEALVAAPSFSLADSDDIKSSEPQDPLDQLFTPATEAMSEQRVENLFAAVEQQHPDPTPPPAAPVQQVNETPAATLEQLTPSSVGEFRAQSSADETKVYGRPAAAKPVAEPEAPVIVAKPPVAAVEPRQPEPAMSSAPIDQMSTSTYTAEFERLLAAGQARKALILMRLTLAEDDSIELAKIIWQYLPQVWDLLGLRGFSWQPEQGSAALAASLRHRAPPKMSALAPHPTNQRPTATLRSKTPLVS